MRVLQNQPAHSLFKRILFRGSKDNIRNPSSASRVILAQSAKSEVCPKTFLLQFKSNRYRTASIRFLRQKNRLNSLSTLGVYPVARTYFAFSELGFARPPDGPQLLPCDRHTAFKGKSPPSMFNGKRKDPMRSLFTSTLPVQCTDGLDSRPK